MIFPAKLYKRLFIYGQTSLFLIWLLFSYSIEHQQFFNNLGVKADKAYAASIKQTDLRVQVLASFFAEKRSPLLGSEADFVRIADKYGLPWTLLPAIAGKESSYGKRIPYLAGRPSYNPFGWGITGGRVVVFGSWSEAIETVGQGLYQKYFQQGLTNLAEIERRYTPPSYKTNHHWLKDVTFISQLLENRFNNQEIMYQSGNLLALDVYR